MTATVHPIFGTILQAHGITPPLARALGDLGNAIGTRERHDKRRTLSAAQLEMTRQLDTACRLESTIDELAGEIDEARTDYDEGVITLALHRAREEYTAAVKACAAAMRQVSGLRAELGLQEHPMIAVTKVPG